MDPTKPGWQTSEFWLTVVAKAFAVLVAGGVISASTQTTWENAIGNAVLGIFAILTLARMSRDYIDARTNIKSSAIDAAAGPRASMLLFALAALALLAPGAAVAQSTSSSCFPWRDNVNQRLRNLEQQKQAPAPAPQTDPAVLMTLQQIAAGQQQLLSLLQQQQQQQLLQRAAPPAPAPAAPAAPSPAAPQIYYLPPASQQQAPQIFLLGPQQQIPLGGPPQQQIPLGGQPQQQIPLGPQPQQQIPLGPQPQQQLPLGGPPQQQIPLGPQGGPPQQQIPLGPSPQQAPAQPAPAQPATPQQIPLGPAPMPPAASPPTGYQLYSYTPPALQTRPPAAVSEGPLKCGPGGCCPRGGCCPKPPTVSYYLPPGYYPGR